MAITTKPRMQGMRGHPGDAGTEGRSAVPPGRGGHVSAGPGTGFDIAAPWHDPDVAGMASASLRIGHAELVEQALWDGLTALDDDRAALLLDERGRVVRASAGALTLVGANDGLNLSQQVLGCDQPGDDARLRAAVAAAVRPGAPQASALRLTRRSGRAALLVTTDPLARSLRMLASPGAAALVTIVDPTAARRLRPTLWRSLFELTAREAEFAELLMAGHSVESAAATLRMAIPTARTHLRSIFNKTGTDRQSILLCLLGRVG